MNLKMVKKFIWISLILIVIMGCGSRMKQTDKKLEEIKESIETSETVHGLTEATIDSQGEIKEERSETLIKNQSKSERTVDDSEKNSNRRNVENNQKTVKKTTYYENGQKKSEIESSEIFSKVSDERDYYKNSYESTRTDLDKSIVVQNSIYLQNLKLVSNNKDLVELNKKTLLHLESKKQELKKQSERKGLSFSAMIWLISISVIAGALLMMFISFAWKKFKSGQWYIKLISLINKK